MNAIAYAKTLFGFVLNFHEEFFFFPAAAQIHCILVKCRKGSGLPLLLKLHLCHQPGTKAGSQRG